MKEAAATPAKTVLVNNKPLGSLGDGNVETVEIADEEEAHAINALEPILHREEKARYSPVLNRPDLRAERWRLRNVPPSSDG